MTDQSSSRVSRSPRYPSFPIQWAIECGIKLLESVQLHPVPQDMIAKGLGYKDAKNGTAAKAIATLKAFGILQKTTTAKVQLNLDVRRYKLTPNESDKAAYLRQWVRTPQLYAKLLEKHGNDLPPEQVLVFELVDEQGFNERAAQQAVRVLRASLAYVEKLTGEFNESSSDAQESFDWDEGQDDERGEDHEGSARVTQGHTQQPRHSAPGSVVLEGVRYPVRLAGGRMAWIDVPDELYEADKKRLQAQLSIIGTIDEDDEFETSNI